MRAVSHSKKGEKSVTNEDACLVLASMGVFVVADGVGGGPRGDFASRTLVDEIYQHCTAGVVVTESVLINAVQTANCAIYSAAQSPELNGMASTVAIACVVDGQLTTIHVGDSRVYCIDSDGMRQLTKDHVKIVDRGENHKKQVVTNAIGVRESVRLDIGNFDLSSVFSILLVSDGITDVLNDDVIESIISDPKLTYAARVARLIEESERLGGRDDKTVIMVFNE